MLLEFLTLLDAFGCESWVWQLAVVRGVVPTLGMADEDKSWWHYRCRKLSPFSSRWVLWISGALCIDRAVRCDLWTSLRSPRDAWQIYLVTCLSCDAISVVY